MPCPVSIAHVGSLLSSANPSLFVHRPPSCVITSCVNTTGVLTTGSRLTPVVSSAIAESSASAESASSTLACVTGLGGTCVAPVFCPGTAVPAVPVDSAPGACSRAPPVAAPGPPFGPSANMSVQSNPDILAVHRPSVPSRSSGPNVVFASRRTPVCKPMQSDPKKLACPWHSPAPRRARFNRVREWWRWDKKR